MSAYGCCDEYNEHADTCPFRTVGKDVDGDSITYLESLESQLSQVQEQREELVRKNCELDNINIEVSRQRDALKVENERMRGALEITANNIGLIQDGSSQQRWAKIVDQALSSSEGEG